MDKPFAIVTGASSGIGLELGAICAQKGFDLLVAADRSEIHTAADRFRLLGAAVTVVETDLATTDGVDQLWAAAAGRPVDALLANAGHGLGHAFLDQDFNEVRHVVDTNITGTIYLAQLVGRAMRDRGQGRILFTGSIAGFMPGTYHAVYNGTKAFVDSFSFALRAELKDSGVTVTCLMPGATETDFFERADMLDTAVGQGTKDDPVDVARVGFDAMMRGDGDVVSGWKNKLQSAIANVTPAGILAEQHRKKAEPGSAQKHTGAPTAPRSRRELHE
jgi:short-subunit dehydrogenase